MTVRKLSDSDKSDILNLYRQAGETTSTLAERYGVSNSTISRLLKSTLPEDEYEVLIASKRAARTHHPDVTPTLLLSPVNITAATDLEIPVVTQMRLYPDDVDIPVEKVGSEPESQLLDPESVPLDRNSGAQVTAVAQILGEDLMDSEGLDDELEDDRLENLDDDLEDDKLEDLDDDLDDKLEDLDDDDLEDDELEDLDDDLERDVFVVKRRMPSQTLVQVLPLSEANLPKICYLVIDRASELITRPLKDFGDLGQIPTQEVQQITLPVFDNHRVARRFSTKRDRVIKIPDSRLLQKTCSQLQAKGITRLLIDSQVYSLSPTLP